MFPRKEVRLFLFAFALLSLGIGIRAVCIARLNRNTPQWVRPSTAYVAQAASISTMGANTLLGDSDGGAALPGGSPSIAVDDSSIRTTGTAGAVTNQLTVAASTTQDAPPSGSSGSAADPADTATSSSAQAASPVTPENTCINPDGSRRLNLNSATAAELDALPGIGPAYAAAILQERARRGQFTDIRQLLDVKGIGPARFAKLESLVCVLITAPTP